MLGRFGHTRVATKGRRLAAYFVTACGNEKSSTSLHRNNYALIIAGGKPGHPLRDMIFTPHSEEVEYLNAKAIYQGLTKNGIVPKENIKTFFGNGEKSPKVVISPGLPTRIVYHLDRFVAKLKDKKAVDNTGFIKVDEKGELPVTGKADTDSISSELLSLSKAANPHDRIFIFIDGHGAKGLGTVLWNKYLTTQFITPKQLDDWLQQFHPDVEIFLYVESCHSGNYFTISRKNTYVYSSSNFGRVSYYRYEQTSLRVEKFVTYLSRSQTALYLHAQGAYLQNNYFSLDSLSVFLNDQLASYHHYSSVYYLANAYQKVMIKLYATGKRGLAISIGFNFALALGIGFAFPVDHLLNRILSAKFVFAGLKVALPFTLKMIYVVLLQKYLVHLENKFKNTNLYRKYPVFLDEIIIRDMMQQAKHYQNIKINPEMQKFLQSHQEELVEILSKLFELRMVDLNKPVISSYNLTFRKAVLILERACRNNDVAAIERFIEIAKNILDPFGLNVQSPNNSRAEKFTTRYLIKKSIFAPKALMNAQLCSQIVPPITKASDNRPRP